MRSLPAALLTLSLWHVVAQAAPPAPPPPATRTEQQLLDLRVESVVQLVGDTTRGSGVVVSTDGLVITSAKTVGKSRTLDARLYNGPSAPPHTTVATLVVKDDWFAVLKLDGKDFKPAPLGHTADLKLNDRVFAIDHGAGMGFTLSLGGVGVVTPLQPDLPRLQDPIPTLIPFNAANVGGPVFNLRGQVVGIMQSPDRGTRALRVEDVRDFLMRHRSRLPQREIHLGGAPGMVVSGEKLPPTDLPTTLTYTHGDILRLSLARGDKPCGVLRPDTFSLEPVQDLTLGTTQPVGTLTVVTTPPGATINVDGRDLGPTPASLDCMEPGTHTVKLTREGHDPDSRTVEVRAGDEHTLEVKLRRLEGYLKVRTHPSGGEVWIDGVLVGVAPLEKHAVTPGKHVVSLRYPGGARVRRELVFQDRKTIDVGEVSLPAPGALFRVDRRHINRVFVDGREHGNLRGWFVLRPGQHVIQAEDELGNVLTDSWDAPLGGVRVLSFQGDGGQMTTLLHVLGWSGLILGGATGALGLALLAGVPLGVHLVFTALGGALDAVHRQVWIPTVVAGATLGGPWLIIALVSLSAALLIPPWEVFLAQGEVVPTTVPDVPIPFTPTEGWDPRPVARARAPEDDATP
ncbi:MAG: PEGA domain-containing protein, partial [Myxococcota bacterium]